MLAIIDYGMGNLRSVQKGLEISGFEAVVTGDPGQVAEAKGVILPGVGAFADAMKNLERTGMKAAIKETVRRGHSLLGICLGMQLLFSESEENGTHSGLGLVDGRVLKLPSGPKVPHMGWNEMETEGDCPLFKGIPGRSRFYFVHSYYCRPDDESLIAGRCDYGVHFCCAVARAPVYGTQFHPEKSSALGLAILKNFGEMVET